MYSIFYFACPHLRRISRKCLWLHFILLHRSHKNSIQAHVFDGMGGSVYTSLRPRSVIRFDYFCLSEPKINASDQIILPLDGSIKPVLLKCNLTTAQTPHKDSFWMKNGQEITNTRSEQKNTTYR